MPRGTAEPMMMAIRVIPTNSQYWFLIISQPPLIHSTGSTAFRRKGISGVICVFSWGTRFKNLTALLPAIRSQDVGPGRRMISGVLEQTGQLNHLGHRRMPIVHLSFVSILAPVIKIILELPVAIRNRGAGDYFTTADRALIEDHLTVADGFVLRGNLASLP